MKSILTTIAIFISSFLFSQNLDSLTFEYINQYRVKNGRKALIWSDKLFETCVTHSNNMVINDSAYHSHGPYFENVSYGRACGFFFEEDYKIFIKKYFNLSYEDVLKNINVYCASDAVYGWYISKPHNAIMLSNKTYGAVHIVLKDVTKKNNFVFGKEVFKGAGKFHYEVTIAETLQME